MAQLVEQLTVNQWVTGSSPVIPANMLVWLNGRAADLEVEGSSPFQVANLIYYAGVAQR